MLLQVLQHTQILHVYSVLGFVVIQQGSLFDIYHQALNLSLV